MSKTRELKRQLEEVLGNMQLWLDTLTPPEKDPYVMDWEAAPEIEIPAPQPTHVDPLRYWHPAGIPLPHVVPEPLFHVSRASQPPLATSIDRFLRPDLVGRRVVQGFRTGMAPMDLDGDGTVGTGGPTKQVRFASQTKPG